jgi:hypothetical protein
MKQARLGNHVGQYMNNFVWASLTIKDWLGFTVLGTTVATAGSLIGILLKDYAFSRSFEKFKQQQSLDSLFQKYRDPLSLATCDLVSRLVEILDSYPTVYLNSDVHKSSPDRQVLNSINDAYFQRYKLISTIYRVSAFLAWLELYRQDLTFLHPQDNRKLRRLEKVVHSIRTDFADGQINTAADWEDWRDTLVFREELRAIGESLIESRGLNRSVIGYGRYCELLESSEVTQVNRWGRVLHNFFLDLQPGAKDFRRVRLERLLFHTVELLRLLRSQSVEGYMVEAIARHSGWREDPT